MNRDVGGAGRQSSPGSVRGSMTGASMTPHVPEGCLESSRYGSQVGNLAAAHFPHAEILNRLRAEIEAPLSLRYVRPQTLRRSFWCDRAYVPLKLGILAALFLLASWL